jgi:hypothetical protein
MLSQQAIIGVADLLDEREKLSFPIKLSEYVEKRHALDNDGSP